MKKTILIDLDGVLNSYEGNYNENEIPMLKQGAFEFLRDISKLYKVKIFTNRNLLLVSKWILENRLDKFIDDVTNIKELNYLIVDDRCIKFDGNYKILKTEIEKFRVWYKK